MENKFEIGTSWRTRGGWRAVVVKQFANTMIVYHDCDHMSVKAQEHKLDGIHVDVRDGYVSSADLIVPYVEPRTGEFWVNVYKETLGSACLSKASADHSALPSKRLACVRVKWTEGEGLTDNKGGTHD